MRLGRPCATPPVDMGGSLCSGVFWYFKLGHARKLPEKKGMNDSEHMSSSGDRRLISHALCPFLLAIKLICVRKLESFPGCLVSQRPPNDHLFRRTGMQSGRAIRSDSLMCETNHNLMAWHAHRVGRHVPEIQLSLWQVAAPYSTTCSTQFTNKPPLIYCKFNSIFHLNKFKCTIIYRC